MDLVVKLVLQDPKGLQDHKGQVDFLFKDFQEHQVKKERKVIVVSLANRVSQEHQDHLDGMDLKVKGVCLAKTDPQGPKVLLGQWEYLVLLVFQVLWETLGHKVELDPLVLLV